MTRDRDTFDMFKPRSRERFGDDERADKEVERVKIVDLDLLLHAETYPGQPSMGAYLVSDNGDENKAQWIPKRLCQLDDTGKTANGTTKAGQSVTLKCVTITTEEWVAKDKGLI